MTVYRRGSKARFTLHMAPYVDTRTLTYDTISRHKLTQDTADANYMLLAVVVNRHNFVAGWMAKCNMPMPPARFEAQIKAGAASVYVQ